MISKESTVSKAFQYRGRMPQREKAHRAARSPVREEGVSEAGEDGKLGYRKIYRRLMSVAAQGVF